MKSTGEVMGSDRNLEKALYKAFEAAGLKVPEFGSVLFTIADETKEEALALAKRFAEIGFSLIATKGTANYLAAAGLRVKEIAKISESKDRNVVELIRNNQAQLVINTMDTDRQSASIDGFVIRREAVEHGVPLLTSLDTADAILKVMEDRAFSTNAI